jgi:hypothetical protein
MGEDAYVSKNDYYLEYTQNSHGTREELLPSMLEAQGSIPSQAGRWGTGLRISTNLNNKMNKRHEQAIKG